MARGITITEQATPLQPTRDVGPALPVVYGCAPVHKLDDYSGAINTPIKAISYTEQVLALGTDSDFEKYDLCEFADLWFRKAGNHPAIFVNVFDPEAHFSSVVSGVLDFASGASTAFLSQAYVLESGFALYNSAGALCVEDTDYTVDWSTGEVTRIDGQALGNVAAAEGAEASYDFSSVDAVDETDLIGDVDPTTGASTGLELTGDIFPLFGDVPGQLVAPKFGEDPAVAIALAAKADGINGLFKAMVPIDLDGTQVAGYAGAGQYKSDNSLTDPLMLPTWPRTKLGDVTYRGSVQLAASAAKTIRKYGEIPYKSPSNESIWANSLVNNGSAVVIRPEHTQTLEGAGIVTFINWAQSGFRVCGSRTGAYPATTDPKDGWTSIRWMLNWIENKIALTSFQWLDMPYTPRQIDRVLDSINGWLNSLPKDSMYAGGRLLFEQADNPEVNVLDGKAAFRLYVAPPPPITEINYLVRYNPDLIAPALFG